MGRSLGCWRPLHSKEQVVKSVGCKGQGCPSLGIISQQAAPWITHLRTGVETGYRWLTTMVFKQSVTGDAHAFPPQPADSVAAGKPLQGHGQCSCDSVPRLSLFLGGGCLIYPASSLSCVKMRLDSLFDNSCLRYFLHLHLLSVAVLTTVTKKQLWEERVCLTSQIRVLCAGTSW